MNIPSGRILSGRALSTAAALALTGFAALPTAADAQSVEQFYKGKTVNVYIGFTPGGTYDIFGRMVARYIGKYIPGQPTVVAQNMPGAGSFKAANFVYAVAPKDGTALGIVSQTVALEEALGTPGVQYKSAELNWVGRATSNIEVQLTWMTSKTKTMQDALTNETPVASTGPGSPSEGYPRLLNGLIGTKFKIIGGYPGSTDGLLAMERGEVDGALTSWNTVKVSRADWLREKKINILVQYTIERSPEIPDVPTFVELGKTDEDKKILAFYVSGGEIGRSFFTTPGVPKERVAALRKAFSDMVKDPDLLADIDHMKADFIPLDGEKLQKLIEDTAKVSPAIIAKMQTHLRAGQ
ncbi:MAG TPA: tripartite tricarboxylate transporter substrate-binding protein [Alphaproteobacteria bacterium]